MKILVNLINPIKDIKNIDLILKDNIDSIKPFSTYDGLNIDYIIWTFYLEDQGWCIASKYPVGIEDPTLSQMLSEPIDKIIIDLSSKHINNSKSPYIRDIKINLIND